MAEYIERGAVQKMINKLANEPRYYHRDETFFDGISTVNIDLCDIPTADVVEVVRCKDCMWWYPREYGSVIGRCENPYNGLATEYIEEYDFCSYGKRKEGAEE